MRRIIVALIGLLLCLGIAHAQMTLIGVSGNQPSGAAYTGPGDIVAFSHWYGLRAYSTAKRGSAAVNVCNVADATCSDVSTDASLGTLSFSGSIGGQACSVAISSGTYVTATGVVTLTVSTSTSLTASANPIAVTGITGTASVGPLGDLNGGFVTTAGTTGTTVTYTAPTGLGTVTITGGTVSSCTAKTLYDQAATNNLTNATIASRPVLGANVLNTSWGLVFNSGASAKLTSVSTLAAQAQPYFVALISNWEGAQAIATPTINPVGMDGGAFNGALVTFDPGGGSSFQVFAGVGLDQVMTINAWHALQGVYNGASSVNRLDGTEVTGASGSNSAFAGTASFTIGSGSNGACNCFMAEVGYIATTVSSGNRASLNTNMHAAYGSF